MKWAGAMLAAWSAAAAAHGDTWADWLAPAANAPVVAEFESGWALESKTASAYSEAERIVPLNLGYDGSLVFRLAPGAEPPPGPLQVRVSFSVAAPNEMNWPANNDLPDDFVPMVLPQARPRPPVAEDVRRLPPEFPLRVPVVRPWDCRTPISFHTDRPAALFGRYAAFDGTGREVCRGFLPASRLVENRRSLAGLVDADEALKQVTSDLGSLERVRDLPNEMEAYRQIRGIWFTESLWNEVQGRTALLRRLLLSGVRLSGETALVERIRGALGTGRDGQAVAASARPGRWNSGGEFSLRQLTPCAPSAASLRKGNVGAPPRPSLLDNQVDLFWADRKSYLAWTLGWLGAFAAGTAVLLGVVSLRFKGERRVAIWWALPVWALLCSAGLWAGGAQVLERRPRADVTEYRLAMAGWPEMHCRAVATALTFQPGRSEWTLPPEAIVYDRDYEHLDGWWARRDALRDADGLRLRLPRRPTGREIKLEAGWFEPTALPLVPEDGTSERPGRWLVAVQDVDAAFALVAGEWRQLGALKAGERRDPAAAPVVPDNELAGLPKALADEFHPWLKNTPCRDPKRPPAIAAEPPPSRHDWVVVALKRDVPPRVAPTWETTRLKGRTIWVLQCP